jgi:hypothetical protein
MSTINKGHSNSSSLATRLFTRRSSSIGVSCVDLNQTINDFTFARNVHRYVQGKSELLAENALLR